MIRVETSIPAKLLKKSLAVEPVKIGDLKKLLKSEKSATQGSLFLAESTAQNVPFKLGKGDRLFVVSIGDNVAAEVTVK